MAAADTYTKKSNKYNHLHGEDTKPDQHFLDIRQPFASGEAQFVQASAKFLAFSAGGGLKLYVKKLDGAGRIQANEPCVSADFLKGKALDWDFNPFIDKLSIIDCLFVCLFVSYYLYWKCILYILI